MDPIGQEMHMEMMSSSVSTVKLDILQIPSLLTLPPINGDVHASAYKFGECTPWKILLV